MEVNSRRPRSWLWKLALVAVVVAGLSALVVLPALAKGNDVAPAAVRPVNVRFQGVVTALDTGTLTVKTESADINVVINDQTEINQDLGPLQMDATVMVQGVKQQDGSVLARVIKVLRPPVQRPRPIEFTGEVTALPTEGVVGEWTVGDHTVVVSTTTQILPLGITPAISDTAHVAGVVNADDKVEARVIQIRKRPDVEVKFTGPIQSISADVWVVRRISVTITADTEITGATPAVGLVAEVAGVLQPDKSVIASAIHVRPAAPEAPTISFEGVIVDRPTITGFPQIWTIRPTIGLDDASLAVIPGVISVTVTVDTHIDETRGAADIGALVKVRASVSGTAPSILSSDVTALDIVVLRPAPESQTVKFTGTIVRKTADEPPAVWGIHPTLSTEDQVMSALLPRVISVTVTTTTTIDTTNGNADIGALVEVEALLQPSLTSAPNLTAIKITVLKPAPQPQPFKFRGIILSKSAPEPPAIWGIRPFVATDDSLLADVTRVISVSVTDSTVIDQTAGNADIGALVEVEAVAPASVGPGNGTLTALKIIVLQPAPGTEPISFTGPIQYINDDLWVVKNTRVHVLSDTMISGAEPRIGLTADVTGTVQLDRSVVASNIFVHQPPPTAFRFGGVVLTIPEGGTGTWKITYGMRTLDVQVNADTVVVGEPHVGSPVIVTCLKYADGTLVATRIEVRATPTIG